MVSVINELERRGFVDRERAPEDKRLCTAQKLEALASILV
ncbi:MAG: hypothetical protein JWR35_2208 [Marmoricola sp.]|nr:hypothetical protein [Marmoricola sp.]